MNFAKGALSSLRQLFLPDSPPVGMNTLRSFLDNLAEGLILADRNRKLIYINKAAERILGIAETGIGVETWSTVYGCYRSDRLTEYPSEELPLSRALMGEAVRGAEIYIRNRERPEGVWILADGSPLRDDAGELWGGVVLFRDITMSKESEETLQMLTNAVEQTADSILITDRQGVVEYVNPAFERTTGYARHEIIGQTPRILKSGVHSREFYREFWTTIQSGKVFKGKITNRRKSGDIYYAEQTVSPMLDRAGKITHFVSVIKDVTDQVRLREQEHDLRLARAVQQHFYDVSTPEIEGIDIAGSAHPAAHTGGDHFDCFSLSGSQVGISIGDISGHGLASALLMVELRACLRAFARQTSNVGRILTMLNDVLLADLEQNRFATLIFCRLNPASRHFVYANAGHVPGCVLDAKGNVRRLLESTDPPLGMFPKSGFATSGRIRLQPGEILALFTDGLLEATGGDHSQFGIDRAVEVIRACRHQPARSITAALHAAVKEHSNGRPQEDDIAVVILRCS